MASSSEGDATTSAGFPFGLCEGDLTAGGGAGGDVVDGLETAGVVLGGGGGGGGGEGRFGAGVS